MVDKFEHRVYINFLIFTKTAIGTLNILSDFWLVYEASRVSAYDEHSEWLISLQKNDLPRPRKKKKKMQTNCELV